MWLVIYLLIVIVVLTSPVRLWVDFRHQGLTEDSLLLQSQVLWGAKTFALELPVIATEKKGVKIQARTGGFSRGFRIPTDLSWDKLGLLKKMLKIAKPIMRKQLKITRRLLKVDKFVWHTEVGINDCAALAQLTGGLWGLKGMAAGKLQSVFKFNNQPILRIRPRFNQSYFRTVFSCILVFPLGYIIIAAIFTGFLLVKLKLELKRGEKKDVRTSNSGTNEDSHGKHQGNG